MTQIYLLEILGILFARKIIYLTLVSIIIISSVRIFLWNTYFIQNQIIGSLRTVIDKIKIKIKMNSSIQINLMNKQLQILNKIRTVKYLIIK